MEPAPIKPTIPFEQLGDIDIRIGTILSVAEVPDSRKLMRFEVDFGDHERTRRPRAAGPPRHEGQLTGSRG